MRKDTNKRARISSLLEYFLKPAHVSLRFTAKIEKNKSNTEKYKKNNLVSAIPLEKVIFADYY